MKGRFPVSRSVSALVGTASIAMLFGFAYGRRPATVSWPIERPVPAAAPTTGGAQETFAVAIVPDTVQVTEGREVIRYHAELTSRRDNDGAVAWTALVIDDVGNVVRTLDKSQGIIRKNAPVSTPALLADLADGYYVLRVRAALHAADGDDVAEAVQYLAVIGRKMRELSFEDFYAQSRIGLAVQISASGGAQ